MDIKKILDETNQRLKVLNMRKDFFERMDVYMSREENHLLDDIDYLENVLNALKKLVDYGTFGDVK